MLETSNAHQTIDDDDNLGRCVYSGRDKKKINNGHTPYRLFFTNSPKISVDRLDYKTNEQMTEIADANGENRKQKFYGWAEITVRATKEMDRKVEISPTLDNPWHADIVLPENAKEDEILQKEHAHSLALHARWRDRHLREPAG